MMDVNGTLLPRRRRCSPSLAVRSRVSTFLLSLLSYYYHIPSLLKPPFLSILLTQDRLCCLLIAVMDQPPGSGCILPCR
jgi:hypothetical protein